MNMFATMRPRIASGGHGARAAGAIALATLVGLAGGARAAVPAFRCAAESPPQRVALLELYTSEGCSSCPPADEWLSALAASPLDGRRAVPVAFHVDYWDRLGWPDRFADPRHTARQRGIAHDNGLRSIYTPQVVVDGRDMPRWYRHASLIGALERVSRDPAGVVLAVEAVGRMAPGAGASVVDVRISLRRPADGTAPATANVLEVFATEDGLASDVARGENAGRALAHDRVVRAWADVAPAADGSARAQLVLPPGVDPGRLALVVHARAADRRSLQAVACRPGGASARN